MSASNQLSPGVVIQERDLTTVTAPVGLNVGVLAAPFTQGPVEEIVEIASERSLVNIFGEPNDYNNNQDCAIITADGWFDENCSLEKGFVCQAR